MLVCLIVCLSFPLDRIEFLSAGEDFVMCLVVSNNILRMIHSNILALLKSALNIVTLLIKKGLVHSQAWTEQTVWK